MMAHDGGYKPDRDYRRSGEHGVTLCNEPMLLPRNQSHTTVYNRKLDVVLERSRRDVM